MTDIKAGDWVKATITGKAEDAIEGAVLLEGWDYRLYSVDGVEFEKIEKPALLPGSVIRHHSSGETLMKMQDGPGWVDTNGIVTDWAITLDPYDVIFDAGKAS